MVQHIGRMLLVEVTRIENHLLNVACHAGDLGCLLALLLRWPLAGTMCTMSRTDKVTHQMTCTSLVIVELPSELSCPASGVVMIVRVLAMLGKVTHLSGVGDR